MVWNPVRTSRFTYTNHDIHYVNIRYLSDELGLTTHVNHLVHVLPVFKLHSSKSIGW